MASLYIPSVLRPEFTWSRPMQSAISQSTHPPSTPAWGILHKELFYLSPWYCSWFNIAFDVNILQLPFGLVLKWTDRANLEEAVAMQMARAAGMPVPKLLCCGKHPNAPYSRTFSILMTRLPGVALENSSYQLEIDAEGPWLEELKTCVHSMRSWYPPDQSPISSPIGTSIRSSRVPDHIMGPFTSEREFHDYLFSPASSHAFESHAEHEQTLVCAKKLQQRSHRIVFTHGDLKAHNIIFTTAMRFGRGSWWFQVASWIGGDQNLEELASDVALNLLTVDSYIAF
ncbi:phosphotransferase family protein [Aspergillus flavus]|uniref:Phosphotransferase family protein n=1 Tax=Aspergillus flavus (strain ATCC 200026 / FGSC A1120 / IAM 13836 / NRRL 3357 / JCM 12722 / SRRC 167) TaxID=332952 RepID=A0A7U2MPP7_ASPFN|nr:phosphotransferase family protein [Aspergillus flavus]